MKFFRFKIQRERPGIFVLFLLISLLIHLLAGLLLMNLPLFPEIQPVVEQTPVTLEEHKNWLELDQKPKQPAEKPPPEATHLASANQKVEKETAPKAEDSRDSKASSPQRQLAEPPKPGSRPASPQPPPGKKSATPPLPQAETGEHTPFAGSGRQQPQIPLELPKLRDLTNLAPKTLARLDNQRQRTKDRPEVQLKDDEAWLNLREDDRLISFFRRFSDRIEAVWNYPVEASSKGIEGTLLLKIVVNKKGELVDVLPLESSGSEILDYEAIQAVYRAAPFGKLPSYYRHEQLKIYAHFQYRLSHRMIYGHP